MTAPIRAAELDPATATILAFPLQRVSVARRRRPRLLVEAARQGQAFWRRERDLPRLMAGDGLPPEGAAATRLAAEEARLEAARRAKAADYALERHVAVLIALLHELRLRRDAAGPAEAVSGL